MGKSYKWSKNTSWGTPSFLASMSAMTLIIRPNSVGTLEVMHMEMLQEILAPLGHVVLKLQWFLHLPCESCTHPHTWAVIWGGRGQWKHLDSCVHCRLSTAGTIPMKEKRHNLRFLTISDWAEKCQGWPMTVFWGGFWADSLVSMVLAQSHTPEKWQGQNSNCVCRQAKYFLFTSRPYTFSPKITVFWPKRLMQLLKHLPGFFPSWTMLNPQVWQ